MTSQTMFEVRTTRTLAERLENTPLDLEKGRAREFRVMFTLTLMVLIAVFAVARIARPASGPRRSLIAEARTAALAALPYAYRH